MKPLTFSICILLTVVLCLSGCTPAAATPVPSETFEPALTQTPAPPTAVPEPSPTARYRELVVYPDQELQTVLDIGSGNFIHYFGQSRRAFEPISEFNWKTLAPKVVRVGMELETWEPVNDNGDPSVLAPAAFVDEAGDYNRATFEFLKRAQQDGAITIASVWRVPGWLVENPEDDSGQVIPRDLYPEAVESMTAWLLHARDEYGVRVDYVSFNEANLGIRVLLSPLDAIEMIRQSGERFRAVGLDTKWLLGDTSNMAEAVSYSEWVWREESIRPYLGPLAFHSWDAGAADATLDGIGKFALENGLEVWCTEGGWDPALWQTPDKFPTWTHALNMTQVYTRALKYTRATAFLYWEMMGGDYAINDGSKPYLALQAIAEMQRQFPSGSVILQTGRDFGAIDYTAARVDGGVRMLVVNSGLKETVDLSGLPDGAYDLLAFDREGRKETGTVIQVIDGTAALEIPGFTILWLLPR